MTDCPRCGAVLDPVSLACAACTERDAAAGPTRPRPEVDHEWLSRPIGLGLPTKRSSAFNVMRTSTAPPPNAYLAAQRRIEAQEGAKAAAAPTTCPRCAAVLLPTAAVCTSCCAPLAGNIPQPVSGEAAATTSTTTPVLASWPFGGEDAAPPPIPPGADVAPPPTPRGVAPTTVAKTYSMPTIPTPRTETQSVPSVGPNPFLAAARMEQARAQIEALEADQLAPAGPADNSRPDEGR